MQADLPRRIIVFCLPGIGDTVLFTPALRRLRQMFPQAHITVLTMFRGTEHILATNPDLNEVRNFDFFNSPPLQSIRYLWKLRREGYDLGIMAFPSNRFEYNVVNWFVSRRWRAAHRYHKQSWQNLWFLNNITTIEDGALHNVAENLRLLHAIAQQLGLPTDGSAPVTPVTDPLRLFLNKEDEQYGADFNAKQGIAPGTLLIGFHTWSSTYKNMTRKCWDKHNFVRLIQRLGQAHPQARYLIFCGPADEAVNQYIMQQTDQRVVLVREPNLRHALGVLKHCRLFISNDSGMMHLAAACGVPVLSLFGPTNAGRLHPWTTQYAVVKQDLSCMPCFYYSSRPLRCVANLNYACMRDITVDEVFQTAEKLLANAHP